MNSQVQGDGGKLGTEWEATILLNTCFIFFQIWLGLDSKVVVVLAQVESLRLWTNISILSMNDLEMSRVNEGMISLPIKNRVRAELKNTG